MGRLVIVALGVAFCAAVAGCTSIGGATPSPSEPATTPPVPQTSAPAPTSHTSPPTSQCPRAFRTIVDHGTRSAKVTEHVQRAANLITCRYLIDGARCRKASVLVNTAANAFIDFQRWAVETGQVAMWTHHPALHPLPVPGIGIEADWVRSTETFETATERSWVAVFLTCAPHAAADRQLAIALGKAGLAARPAR